MRFKEFQSIGNASDFLKIFFGNLPQDQKDRVAMKNHFPLVGHVSKKLLRVVTWKTMYAHPARYKTYHAERSEA